MAGDERATNLRMWRTRRGYSQDRLAALADLTKSTIQNLESGKTQGYMSTWRRLAETLEVSVDALLGSAEGADRSDRTAG